VTDAAPNLDRLRIARPPEDYGSSGRSLVPLLLVVLLLGGGGFIAFRFVPRAVTVRVGAVLVEGGAPATSTGTLSANGYVVARRSADVAPAVPGRLVSLEVEESSPVKKGQVLARLEDDAQKAQLAAAQAALAQVVAGFPAAERAAQRANRLLADQAGTGLDLERAQDQLTMLEAQRAAAEAQVRVAEVALEQTRIRAPFDGTVLDTRGEPGEFVSPGGIGLTGTGILTLADLATLEVEVDVNEAYIARVSPDQPVFVALDSLPGTRFAGRVLRILPTADRQKATVRVRVAILDKDPRILPQMGARVSFVSEADAVAAETQAATEKRVIAPANAVVRGGDGSARVFVIDGGIAISRAVTLGALVERGYEVESGLLGAEQVVLAPPPTLADGAKIAVAP
jgi:RND family efflux transporter MFP subunit